jgi:putative DNA primase/helicase
MNQLEAVSYLRNYGLEVDTLRFGKIQRVYTTQNNKRREKRGWYRVFEFYAKDGTCHITGAFGIYGVGEGENGQIDKIPLDKSQFDAESWKAVQDSIKNSQREEEARRRSSSDRAAQNALRAWNLLQETGVSDYLARKKVKAHGLRYGKTGSVAVPMTNKNGHIRGLQIIYPKAGLWGEDSPDKRFWPVGIEKQGTFHHIGQVPNEFLVICEGYATGASIFEATGYPVFIAWDAYNLLAAAKALKELYPTSLIFFAADDDHCTKGNPGYSRAQNAASAVNGVVIVPRFKDRLDGDKSHLNRTDFNDLACLDGIDEVRSQIREVVGLNLREHITHTEHGDTAQYTLRGMLDRYAMIYGTKVVWDELYRDTYEYDAIKLVIGNELTEAWRSHPKRKILQGLDKIVFDPTLSHNPVTERNLFSGFALKPKKGNAAPLLDLLKYLCSAVGDEDKQKEVYEFVLNWLAYPLQHPGSKMRSALVFFGDEGTGKNTFFEAYAEIFGKEYSMLITQAELNSEWNEWQSKKMFIIANEVVTRQDMYSQQGIIRNMLTEPRHNVRRKFQPSRQESNLCNFVFFSNNDQPVVPTKTDRRFLIINTPPKAAKEFYMAIKEQIENSACIEALYQFLLDRDLGDFNEFTLAPMTDAKEDLIEASMPNYERFLKHWREGLIPAPYSACMTKDLYKAYRIWCEHKGEMRPVPEARFANSAARMVRKTRKWLSTESEEANRKQVTVFIPNDHDMFLKKEQGKTEEQWLSAQCAYFSDCISERENWL